jgi:tetratricopeptide (TPR) repeat protein
MKNIVKSTGAFASLGMTSVKNMVFRDARKLFFLGFAVFTLASCGSAPKDVRLEVHGDVKALTVRGNEMYFKGRYEDAAKYYDRAKVLAMSIDDRRGIAEALNNLGQLYMVAGDYIKAYEKFEQAHRINDEMGDISGKASNLNNVGSLMHKLHNIFFAELAFESALYYYRVVGDLLGQATVLNNMGLMKIGESDFEGAKIDLNAALKIARTKKRHRLAAASHQNLGRLSETIGEYDAAIVHYKAALASDKLVEYSVGIARDLSMMGALYLRMDLLQDARDAFVRSLEVNISLGFKAGIKDCLENLIIITTATRDDLAASDYRKKLESLR